MTAGFWLSMAVTWCLISLVLALPTVQRVKSPSSDTEQYMRRLCWPEMGDIYDPTNPAMPSYATTTSSESSESSVSDVFISDLVTLETDFKNTQHGRNWHANSGDISSDDDNERSEDLLPKILHQIKNGHVTQSSVSRWLSQIQDRIAEGTMTMGRLNSFLQSLPNAGFGFETKLADLCCPLG